MLASRGVVGYDRRVMTTFSRQPQTIAASPDVRLLALRLVLGLSLLP